MSDADKFKKLFGLLDSNHEGERAAALHHLHALLHKQGKSFRDVLAALDSSVPKAAHEDLLKKFNKAATRSAEWKKAHDDLARRQTAKAAGTTGPAAAASGAPTPQPQARPSPARAAVGNFAAVLFVAIVGLGALSGLVAIVSSVTKPPPPASGVPAPPPPRRSPAPAIDPKLVLKRFELEHYLNEPASLNIALRDPARRDIVLANLIDVYDGDLRAIAQLLNRWWRDAPAEAPSAPIALTLLKRALDDPTRRDHALAWTIWSYQGIPHDIAETLQKLRAMQGPHPA